MVDGGGLVVVVMGMFGWFIGMIGLMFVFVFGEFFQKVVMVFVVINVMGGGGFWGWRR